MSEQFDASVDGEFTDQRYGRVSTRTSEPSIHYINESGLPDDIVADIKENREIANAIERWTQSLQRGGQSPSHDVFARDKWSDTRGVFAQMSQCAWAVEHDDILSTLGDVTEGLTFKKMRFELNDDDQQDMWSQWAREIDLDSRVREQFRELYKVSQFYVGLWWERRTYAVRDAAVKAALDEVKTAMDAKQAEAIGAEPPDKGPGRGNRKRKKVFPVEVPTEITIFDPTKVIPVGQLMFGRERFAYIATRDEHSAFTDAFTGDVADPTVRKLLEGRWKPSEQDKKACSDVGADHNHLWLFREEAVYRHSLTRAQYERWASVRLKAVLPILEMKAHLRASDRATLIGNTNFIVVITKGTDKLPAKAAEIENLREQSRMVARLPVLVGDHRLHVEIVTPPLDNTLAESRWQVLDSRLVFKALQSFQPIVQGGNSSSGVVTEMSQVVAAGLENRRHLLLRSIERFIFAKIIERNAGVLDETPSLAFAPKRITLDFSADVMNAILKLRDRGDVSRETTLDEFDYDQDVEVLRRAREKVDYDEIFQSGTPYGSPAVQPFAPGQPGQPQPGQPGAPVPGQPIPKPITSGTTPAGGRPPGTTDSQPRKPKGTVKA